jgi:predicted DNA-binding ribbon-helix-helix protein
LFRNQDPSRYQPQTRPLRLNGHSTSVRLEAAFWDILEELARKQNMSLGRFASVLYDEMLERDGSVANFASCLRVSCMLYLQHRSFEEEPAAPARPAGHRPAHALSRAVARPGVAPVALRYCPSTAETL